VSLLVFFRAPLHQPQGNSAGEGSARDLLSIQNRQISVENIQKTADYYKIKVADMYSKATGQTIPAPPIAMFLARN
jgi:chromosomal replication initiation ATPase DnaA